MELLTCSADLFVQVAFWTIVHSLWQGALFAISLAAWRRFAHESDHAARSAAATLTLLFLAAAPIVTATVLATSYVRPPAAALDVRFEFASVEENTAFADLPHEPVSAERAPTFDNELLAARLPRAIALLWALGVTCGCARLLASATRLHLVRSRAIVADDALAARCRELARRCGLKRPPQLLRSPSAGGPYTFGLFRPCIVFPAAWALETTPAALEAAVAHELAHLKRRDLWVLALQRLVETALFYHPGVWYVSRTLDVERERAADRLAAEVLGDSALYAESLYRLASLAGGPGSPALTLPFHGETRMKLLERVRLVLRTEESKSGGLASVGWLCVAPALLAAIFLGQAAFAGSLRADDGEREGAAETADVEDEGPEQRGRDEAKERDDEEPENEGRRQEEEGEEERARDDRESGEEPGDRDRLGNDASPEEFRRRAAELNAEIDEMIKRRAEELERKYKAHVQAAQEELQRAMRALESEANARKRDLEEQVAKVMAHREAEARKQAEAERSRGEGREEIGDEPNDLTPRERRMLGVIRSLEARLKEFESRRPREGDRREEGERREERREQGEERRDQGERESDREKPEMKDAAEVPAEPETPDGEEVDVKRFAERLFDALRGGMSEEKKPEFLRNAIREALGFELNDDQIRIVLDRARGELEGFQQIVGRIAAARE